MNDFPPPNRRASSPPRPPAPPTAGDTGIDDAVAARLAALQQRRSPSGDRQRSTPATTTAPTVRRRHPAHHARLGALGLSVVTSAGLAGWFALSGQTASAEIAGASIVAESASSTSATPATPAVPDAPVTEAPPQNAIVSGAVYHNRWGNVQVQATFAPDGSLVDVISLQTPNDRGRSIQINEYAVPRLNDQALTAQSAEVDTVSGATYTSNDYRNSLQSAIDAARAAGITALP
jgi:uncharacterized protein with FMN-binding domain